MGNHIAARTKWLFVATAHTSLAYSLPGLMLKPLATYVGLPLDSRPSWWITLASVVTALLVFAFIRSFRREGAPRLVAWGPVMFVVLSLIIGLLPGGGADVGVSWPLWILSTVLLIGAGFGAAYASPVSEQAPPGRGLLAFSWVWAALMLVFPIVAALALLDLMGK